MVVVRRVRKPWNGVEGIQVSGSPMPEADDIRGNVGVPRVGCAPLQAGLGKRKSGSAVVLQRGHHGTYRLAFVRDVVPRGGMVTSEILLDVRKQCQGVIEPHGQRHPHAIASLTLS